MTITFPRDLPFDGLFTGTCSFDLVRNQTESLTGSASPDVADIAPPYWVAKYSTAITDRAMFAEFNAWLTSLRGGLRLFKGRPNRHRWPLTYPRGFAGLTVGGDPWDGLGTLSNIAAGRDVVTIDDLPNGLVLKPGDYFSIAVGSLQHLHMITEGGVASSNEVTVTCEPSIIPGVVTGGDVRLDAPYCDMNITGKPDVPRNPVKGGTISFSAQQRLI